MTRPAYHIAQYNVARMRAPLEDPIMDGFRSRLDELNQLGDRSPGFVWRYHTEDGTSTSIRPYPDDPLVIINMTVWESIEALHSFTYKSDHGPMYAARHAWFDSMDGSTLVLWWVVAGHRPDPSEGKARLDVLRQHGPSPDAFTMKQRFPRPDSVPLAGGSAARP
jgi:hypothetical protein